MFMIEFVAPTAEMAEALVRTCEYYLRARYSFIGIHRENTTLTPNRKGYKVIVTTPIHPTEIFDHISHPMIRLYHRGLHLRGGRNKGQFRIMFLFDAD